MRQRLTVSILGLSPHMQLDLERLSKYLNDVPGLQAFALNPQTEMAFLLVDETFDLLELEAAFERAGLQVEWLKSLAARVSLLEQSISTR